MDLIRIAFFVEGYTEQEFLKRLLEEIFGTRNLKIEIQKIKGGKKTPIVYTTLESPDESGDAKYYILIYNCGGDSKIKSYILDQRESLLKAGYTKIVGIRDLYPDLQRADLHDLVYGLNYKLPQKDIPISFVISVMEIEAWFLAEENHYAKIDTKLTLEEIEAQVGFNPSSHNTELIDDAAATLNSIYQIASKSYRKKQASIDVTIDALDYANIYFVVQHRISSLKNLVSEIEDIFE